MEKALWIVLGALALFASVLTALLLQGAGITNVAEGIAQLDLNQVKRGGLLFTVGAAILTALGMLVAILRSQR